MEGVEFDGFNGKALLEAKAKYGNFINADYTFKDFFVKSKSGVEEILSQADRQLKAAGGFPIEWHCLNKNMEQALIKLFEEKGIVGITVKYNPMPT